MLLVELSVSLLGHCFEYFSVKKVISVLYLQCLTIFQVNQLEWVEFILFYLGKCSHIETYM